jgi:uncharacterized protein (TIGR00369 family)
MYEENKGSARMTDGAAGEMMYCDSLAEMLGIHCESASDGHAATIVDAADGHCNIHGFVHGVVLFAMADIGMGWTLDRHIGSARRITTLSLASNFLSPVRRGRIVAETDIVRVGNTVATLQSRVCDSRGADKALFTGIFHMSEAKT